MGEMALSVVSHLIILSVIDNKVKTPDLIIFVWTTMTVSQQTDKSFIFYLPSCILLSMKLDSITSAVSSV